MAVIRRGIRNAFRNTIRSVSITLILALSIALALVMLLSMKAAESQVDDVKTQIGNTVTVTPAGQRGFAGGGDPLTQTEVDVIESTNHVETVTTSLTAQLSTEGSTSNSPFGSADPNATTNLVTATNSEDLAQAGGGGGFPAGASFSLPIVLTGTNDPLSTEVSGVNSLTLTSGDTIDGGSSDNVALVGEDLATANNLTVGSTFTVYAQTLTVSGIYTSGNTFADGGVIVPLATLQNLSGQPGAVSSVAVTVDSISNLDSTVNALQTDLGSKADVVSDQTNAEDTIASLDNVKTIALYSLIGALVAGSIIIFLSMLMIVRERRREIGVLKAIGSSNRRVTFQFVVEALTLTIAGAVLGVLAGIALSNPVLDVLVNNSSDATAQVAAPFGNGQGFQGGGDGGGANFTPPSDGDGQAARIGIGRGLGGGVTQFDDALGSVSATVGFDIVGYGLMAALMIAILGAALPSWSIAKIRPAEVMRFE